MVDEERRKDLRFRCTGHADLHPAAAAPTLPGRIVDVSTGGCLIELHASQKIVPNETVELTFSINRLPFRVRGEVTSLRSGTAVGFKFTGLSERVQEHLGELIEELAADWRKRFAEHRWYAEDFVRRDAEEMIEALRNANPPTPA
jgi:c-di-GMP-binding flagellar brake protein YcgR